MIQYPYNALGPDTTSGNKPEDKTSLPVRLLSQTEFLKTQISNSMCMVMNIYAKTKEKIPLAASENVDST